MKPQTVEEPKLSTGFKTEFAKWGAGFKGLVSEYFSSKFISRSDTFPYTVFGDSVNKLPIPQQRTNYVRNSFRCSGAVLCFFFQKLDEANKVHKTRPNRESNCVKTSLQFKATARLNGRVLQQLKSACQEHTMKCLRVIIECLIFPAIQNITR